MEDGEVNNLLQSLTPEYKFYENLNLERLENRLIAEALFLGRNFADIDFSNTGFICKLSAGRQFYLLLSLKSLKVLSDVYQHRKYPHKP